MLDIKEIIIPLKYVDYINVFLPDSAAELNEQTGINNHLIDLVDEKQLLFSPIYSLGTVELETLKIYIETNLVNSFI